MDYANFLYTLREVNANQHFLLGGEDYVKISSIGDKVRCRDHAGNVVTFRADEEVFVCFEQLSLF